jgi:hypothetical protein
MQTILWWEYVGRERGWRGRRERVGKKERGPRVRN